MGMVSQPSADIQPTSGQEVSISTVEPRRRFLVDNIVYVPPFHPVVEWLGVVVVTLVV